MEFAQNIEITTKVIPIVAGHAPARQYGVLIQDVQIKAPRDLMVSAVWLTKSSSYFAYNFPISTPSRANIDSRCKECKKGKAENQGLCFHCHRLLETSKTQLIELKGKDFHDGTVVTE